MDGNINFVIVCILLICSSRLEITAEPKPAIFLGAPKGDAECFLFLCLGWDGSWGHKRKAHIQMCWWSLWVCRMHCYVLVSSAGLDHTNVVQESRVGGSG